MKSIKNITAEETYSIRKEVLRKGIDLPYEFNGDFDKDTFHLGAYKNGELVGVVSFMRVKCDSLKGNQYQLRGMATLSKARGLGFGRLLINTATNELKKKEVDFIWCNAREVALKFYENNGFKILGDSFEIDKVGTHFKMYKNLNL
ncbi:ribosomal protein S18 acetylase RimI-like enzyme [Tenacibaculum adriaticum]|uniref:Ribosomal protein S18 acetylase RimI-like enzyme n=1 Tax=Tenacibaculum adriaticum TaxID=413713 RepID=A0A5S5DMW6_9FLAO|nr:GNAT family N-acetyltransferase [Tenacibaculum adriaticum]TYP96728.1 ribosomal protein S18 acetylase RimI-like enzyme [Tenacibaculum adriaticum]